MYKKLIKPFFDIFITLVFIVLLSPLFIIIFFTLSISNRGSAFFFQPRPGKDERIFKVIKFKTMNDKKDQKGKLLPDVQRLTSTGRFIRKTSLDEIPQLLNVLKGDMSLVGPRPLLVKYLPLYNETQKKRHQVKPGITGWAQVNGRNAISWEEKFNHDIWYVKHQSFTLDLKILLKTILKIIKSEDINTQGQATTQAFKGKL